MPIPSPNTGESQSEFMERCMSDDSMASEYGQDQRAAICAAQFDEEPKMDQTMDQKMEHATLDLEFDIKAVHDEEGMEGKFTGYGSVFNNTDLGNDVVMAGAFTKSLNRKGARGVKMLFQHKPDEVIGVYDEIIEDGKGLKVQGRLALGTQRGKEVYELMKMGALDGLSIGYKVAPKGMEYDEKGKKRRLKEVELMEISAVTFPMNPRARVSAVKSEDRTVRDWEEILRDAGELSRSEAKVAASAIYKALNQRDAGDGQEEVIQRMKNLETLFKGAN